MKIRHILNRHKIEDESSADTFILTNREGGYLWLGSNSQSRYQGWFFPREDGLYRIIEGVEIDGAEEISAIINEFDYVETERGEVKERFFLPQHTHSFVYELSEEKRVSVFFDVRHSYSLEENFDYEEKRIEDVVLLSFKNGIHVAVRSQQVEVKRERVKRHYEYDKKRNSSPYEREVLLGLSLYGKKFVFSVAETEEDALREVNKIFVKSYSSDTDQVSTFCAKRTLSDLLVMNKPGIYAGLPWFFQFWPRDEAISLKALSWIEEEKAKSIFYRLLHSSLEDAPRGVINTDALGWTIKRAEDFNFSAEEKEKIKKILKKQIEEVLWSHTKKGFAINGPNETWMDTLDRGGARIEMQALRLNMNSFMASICNSWKERRFYKKLEKDLLKRVRSSFFNGNFLYDGYYPFHQITDKKIRCNIFIAAYIYPQLLSRREWRKCFNFILPSLWLPWGGVSTLDINDPSFSLTHTGEDSKSYHNGDSWFYINNIAAMVLHRVDRKKYAPYIKRIVEASKEEMMWMGVAGRSAEVSSAKRLSSEGSPMQAWSAALYLEMVKELDSF